MYNPITTRVGVTATLLALLLPAAAALADGVADQVTVIDPYVRAVPPVVGTTAAFMQLRSDAATEHFVVEAFHPAAGAVELHMHTMDGEVMRMRRVSHFHLPPGGKAVLQPGGEHIMLFDLVKPLTPGEQVPITLTFDDGSTKQVTAEVRRIEHTMQH